MKEKVLTGIFDDDGKLVAISDGYAGVRNEPIIGEGQFQVTDVSLGAPVVVQGVAAEGETLTAVLGDGYRAGTFQWTADGVNITGATGDTLLITEAEAGKTIAVQVTDLGFVSAGVAPVAE